MHVVRSVVSKLTPIAAAIVLTMAGAQVVSAQESVMVAIQIAPQSLTSALHELARQAGLQLVVSPELVAGKMSPSLSGRYTGVQALAALLKGSGLTVRQIDKGTYVLVVEPKTPTENVTSEGVHGDAHTSDALPDVVVFGQATSMGTTILKRDTMLAIPGGNGDITSLLKIMPNVQFANEQVSTATLGEIAPQDVSINGAKYYDNLFQMDGMSFNSDINPAGGGSEINTPDSPGQGFAIDTSLLCSVTVRDSNVGAEFGRFTGGVVSVDTCAPTKSLTGDVSIEHTSSSWTHYQYAPGQEATYAQSASATKQPKFDKWTYRVALQSKINDELGVIGSVVRKTSDVPLRGYTSGLVSGTDDNEKVRKYVSDNIFLKAFWTPATDVAADASIMYAPSTTRGFIQNAKNSYYVAETGGLGLNLGLQHHAGTDVTLSHRITATQTEGSRDADSNVWKLWRYSSDKNWGNPTGTSGEGGYGDVEQVEKKLGYQLKGDLSPKTWLGWEHKLQSGFEYERMDFEYRRLEDYYQYTVSTNTTTCTQADGTVDTETCSLSTPYNATSGGQYLKNRIVYKAGEFGVKNESIAWYMQDELRKDRLRLRLGLRYEHDRLAPEDSWSPRMAAFYDVFGTGHTNVEVGANRYYGRNFQIYQTYVERLALQSSSQTRTVSNRVLGTWADPVFGATAAMYHVGDLKVPHTDEQVLGVSQSAWNTVWGIKYVQRHSKDEVVLHLRSVGNYWWDNIGKTKTEVLSLTASTQQPIRWGGSLTTVSAGLDYTNTHTSHADYTDTLSSYAGDLEALISYNGKVIRYIDRPADNYNRPWTGRLLISTRVPEWRLTLDNFFRIRDGYVAVEETDEEVEHNGSMIPVWKAINYPKSITWDVRVNYEMPTVASQAAYVQLTVENLLDHRNLISGTGSSATYEKGRQFWLRLGYKF